MTTNGDTFTDKAWKNPEDIFFSYLLSFRNLTDNWNCWDSVTIFKLSFWQFSFFLFYWKNLLVCVSWLKPLIRKLSGVFISATILNGISNYFQVTHKQGYWFQDSLLNMSFLDLGETEIHSFLWIGKKHLHLS